ncbi:hypothetical protein RHSP_59795 [Rhizobium freirei PRF 81]|uniref:Uncharacterized protein n=1 Tax=Rhizobium freirei PRF 81 TaxID=363754 RepID=N6VEV1_9HYPH|nr:hypothetical protein RHSP_59795 [Rhizobium freirei PRF 81]
MIVGERQIHHRADDDLAADGDRTLLDLVHAENARLRRIQNRRGHQRTVDAAVRDGEGAALHVGHRKLTVAGCLAEAADFLLDLGDRHLVGIAHDRNDQALVRADGNADVAVVLVDDVGAVDLGVNGRQFLQRVRDGLGEEAHEAELHAMLLLEDVLVAVAQVHHSLHVHLVVGGEHGGGVLCILEALGDRLAQARHLHTLFAAGILDGSRGAGGNRSGRCGGRSRSGLGDSGDNIALQHLAALAAAIDLIGGEIVFSKQLSSSRCRRHGRSRGGDGGSCNRSSSGRGRCRRGSLCRSSGSAVAGGDLAEQRAEAYGFAGLGNDFGQGAGRRCGDFDRHLVGFKFEKRLIGLDGIADFLEPGSDSRFADGFAEGRNADFSGHCSDPDFSSL